MGLQRGYAPLPEVRSGAPHLVYYSAEALAVSSVDLSGLGA